MLFDGSNVNFLIAFLAGFVSFLAPCVLAIVPVQISYLAGVGMKGEVEKRQLWRGRAFVNGLFFALGLIAVFMVLGVGAGALGRILASYRELFLKIGGAVLIILALYILGVFRGGFLGRDLRLKVDVLATRGEKPRSFLLGAVFGFAWSPCIGPVLAVILFWASSMETFWQGFFLLIFYALGLAAPFLIVSVFIDYFAKYLARLRRVGHVTNLIFGLIILVVGLLLLTNNLDVLIRYSLIAQDILF